MKKIVFAALSIISIAACNPDRKLVKATVVNTGDITSAGCGYLLVLEDSALLKPIELDADYQQNKLPVLIEYRFSGERDTCDYGPKVFEMVTISKIKKDI